MKSPINADFFEIRLLRIAYKSSAFICVLKIYKNKKPRRVARAGFLDASVSGSARDDAYCSAVPRAFGIELHTAVDLGEQCVVLADSHQLPGVVLGTPLANQDGSGGHDLPAEHFWTQTLSVGVSSVS